MSSRSLHSSAQRGLTLLEVIAALAIISTLLVGLLVAARRHVEQVRRARQTLDVAARVDALLYRWMSSGGLVLREDEGELPGEDGLRWKTQLVDTRHRRDLGIDLFSLKILTKSDTVGERPIVSLELASLNTEWTGEGEAR